MKMAVFWVSSPISLVQVSRSSRNARCLREIALMMEATGSFETSVNFYQTTRSNNLILKNIHESLTE
jgi:hypothetical protein